MTGVSPDLEGNEGTAMLIVRFQKHVQLRLGEWFAAIVQTSIGLVLIGFPHMMGERPEYASMISMFSQPAWTLTFLCLGGTRLVALWINGRKPVTPFIRMVFAMLSGFVWYQLMLGLLMSGIPVIGLAVYPWMLALDIYNVFRSSADSREVYDKNRARRHDQSGTFE